MAKIQLNYTEVIALAQRMKTAADNFDSNQNSLGRNINTLKTNWSGSASDVMQRELQDMNKYAAEMQKSLNGMADFVAKAAELIKETDANVFK
jgi:WXG100 family type VII secretion target